MNANGFSTTVTFQYGTSMTYGVVALADQSPISGSTDTAVTAAIYDLVPNETHHYRVVAQNMSGTTYGGGSSLDTLPAELISFTVE